MSRRLPADTARCVGLDCSVRARCRRYADPPPPEQRHTVWLLPDAPGSCCPYRLSECDCNDDPACCGAVASW